MLVFSYVPNMTFIGTSTFINGYGAYRERISSRYMTPTMEQGMCQNFIQIHGHRGVQTATTPYCLEVKLNLVEANTLILLQILLLKWYKK